MNRKGKKTTRRGMALPPLIVLIFLLGVFLPAVVLSLLALRAADREAVYVERSLEAALLAEVNLAAQKITSLLEAVGAELREEAEGVEDFDEAHRWKDPPAPAAFPFFASEGRLAVWPFAPPSLRDSFLAAFGPFLEGREELPVYDSLSGVYRKEMKDLPFVYPAPGRGRADGLKGTASPAKGPLGGSGEELSPSALQKIGESASSPAEIPPPPLETAAPAPSQGPAVAKPAAPGRVEEKIAQSRVAADSALREQFFQKVQEEGFRVLQRNVAPQSRAAPSPEKEEPRSATVSRGKTFAQLRAESPGGFLPGESGRGLELIYWTRADRDGAAGFSIDMEDLRDRIVEAVPDLLTDVRILAVLDDGGVPLAAPPLPPGADWRRPFVAREISPLLPKWEVGAWLTDPGLAASRARFATLAVWLLTGTLFVVILIGAAVIMRMVGAEMRLAASKTSFVTNVSHELKTPLTSIRLLAEILLAGRQQDEERRREYLKIMVSEAERLSRLVDNVLAFSRKGSERRPLSVEEVDLAALAEDTVRQLEPNLTAKGFKVEFFSPRPLLVLGNGQAIKQILMNLLSNGEKYSPAEKEISVTCGIVGDVGTVRVADRGSGVEPQWSEKIFQEFFRGDDSLAAAQSGSGLGLSIARDMARKLGGDVTYEARAGGGSVFSLELPLGGREG